MVDLRNRICEIIGIKTSDLLGQVEYKIVESTNESGYKRNLIELMSGFKE